MHHSAAGQGPSRSSYSSTPLCPGDLYFQDTNGDGIINEADKQIIRTPYPKFTYGFNVNMNYGKIDVSASFNGSYGNQVIHSQDYYIKNMEGSGNDRILMRYTGIILNLAEVYMYLGDNATAIQYLDMARARAGMPGYQAMMTINQHYASRYTTLKLAILHERRIELAFEHHRWHDLTRFFNATDPATCIRSKSQADYNNSPLNNLTAKDYYFPIPLNEYKLNPDKLYQNLGY